MDTERRFEMLAQRQPNTLASPLASELISRGRRNLMFMRQVEGIGVIDEPYRKGDWLYIPIEQDKSSIPAKALQRVERIKDWGFDIQGMIVAHEAPFLLTAPKKEKKPIPWEAIGKGAITVFLAAVVSAGMLAGFMLLTAIQIDPALIICLEDGSRIEVYRWID